MGADQGASGVHGAGRLLGGAAPGSRNGTDGSVTITAIRATPVNIPLEAPYRWSVGVYPGFSKAIVEVETSEGVTGVGEAPSARAALLIDRYVAPRLLGADPRDLVDCERRAVPPSQVSKNTEDRSVHYAFGGVEMALWDVIGKLSGQSVARLLGGRIREEVAFTEYFAPRLRHQGRGGEDGPADLARYCARMAEEHGAVAFEGKVGVFDIPTEVAIVREVRAAVGDDCLLRLDANMRWSVAAARHALNRFERYNVDSVEDPVGSYEEMARLRETTRIGFSSHDPALKTAARLGVPDAFVLNLSALGGIRRTVSFISACRELGVDVWFYSPDTGVANAAYLQVAGAMPWLSQPSQTLLRWHMDDVTVGGPPQPRNGVLPVPDEPGLGVELDREALKRCSERYASEGEYNIFSDPSRVGRYAEWAA
jgi:glucarate dehydratase